MNQPILIFPAGMPRSLEFLGTCLQEQRAVIGASSRAYDPSKSQYPAWLTLPYIHQDEFADELGKAISTLNIGSIFSPHPVVWDFLERELPHIAPGVRLLNAAPANTELNSYRAAQKRAQTMLGTPLPLAVDQRAKPDMPVLEAASLHFHVEVIPGMCDHEKLRALYEIARYCPNGDVVEIGSWWGKSAFAFLRLAQYFGIGKLLCVDPWSDAHLVQGGEANLVDAASAQFSAVEALDVFQINLLPFNQGDVNYLRMPSTEGFKHYRTLAPVQTPTFGITTYTGHIALLHVDGNHSYENAKSDVETWSDLVMPGGWLVIDDYTWPFGDGPKRAGNEYLAANHSRVSTAFVMGGALFIRLNPSP
jgi:Methyltransferase domain